MKSHHRSGLSASTVQICFAIVLVLKAVAAGTSPSEYAVSSLFGLASENATAVTTPADGRYTRRDLLLVIPSCEERLPLVEATRAWRQGVRTVILLNDTLPAHLAKRRDYRQHAANEVYLTYQDVDNSAVWWLKKGDLRAAIAPFLANVTLGADSFSWILYGDDDTFFNVEAVLRMVNALNHTQPYLLTDNVWFPAADGQKEHGSGDAPRCLPCETGGQILRAIEDRGGALGDTGFAPPVGCPCTPELLCQSDNLGIFRKRQCKPSSLRYCTVNLVEKAQLGGKRTCKGFTGSRKGARTGRWFFVHGGAGAVISSGAMRRASFDEVEGFLHTIETVSGDSMLSMAFWSVLGIAPTDPGLRLVRPDMRMFDPGWRTQHRGWPNNVPPEDQGTRDSGNDPEGVVSRLVNVSQGDGGCNATCRDQLRNTITVHIRSRHVDNVTCAELGQFRGLLGYPAHHRTPAYYHFKLAEGFNAFESRACGIAGLLTLWLDRSPTCSSRLAWPVILTAAVTMLAFVLEACRKVRRRRKKRGA